MRFIFLIFFVFFLAGCSASQTYIQSPRDVKKIYDQNNTKAVDQLFELLSSPNLELVSVSISYLEDFLRRLQTKEFLSKEWKEKGGDVRDRIEKMLIQAYPKYTDFNVKNLILHALLYGQSVEKNEFLLGVIQKEDPIYTKIALRSFLYQKKEIPLDEIIPLFDENPLRSSYLLQEILPHIPEEKVQALQEKLGLLKDPYYKNMLKRKLSLHAEELKKVKKAFKPPKVDAPKVEAPKMETPKTGTPKTDTPKVDAPKLETSNATISEEGVSS